MTEDETRQRTLKIANDFQTFITQKRMDEWIELWHDDGVLEFPFAPDGRQQAYRGKKAVLKQMSGSMDRVEIDEVRYFKVRPLQDPASLMVEAGTRARMITTGEQYNQTYVLYIETREGKIWRYREYWNAWTLIKGMGGPDVWRTTWGLPDDEPRIRPFITE